VAFCDSQELVLATRLKGEVTWAPLTGAFTVMADAGTTLTRSAKMGKQIVFMYLLKEIDWFNMKE
jgi:hypothetical protein